MAQSVAHLIGSEEVTSSILVVSIKKALDLRLFYLESDKKLREKL